MADLNPERAFGAIKARAIEAVRGQFPIEGKLRRMELVSAEIKDDSSAATDRFHIDNIHSQYDTKVRGGTWAVPIIATLRLVDKESGEVLDEKTMTIGRLPKLTRRYTYVVEGHERQHDSLFRLRARPYHVVLDNGDIAARWNVASGRGFDIFIDRGTGVFRMKLGSSKLPIYSVLQALDVSEVKMSRAWGSEVLEANRRAARPDDLQKAHNIFTTGKSRNKKRVTRAEAEETIQTSFANTRLRPDAMKATFGKPYENVNGENLLLSTKRLLGISKGTQEPDDRQALSSKDLASTEDFVAEGIERATGEVRRKVLNNLDTKDQISDMVSPTMFRKAILGRFTPAQRPDQTNPLQFVSGYVRTTLRSEEFGGVKGENVNLDEDKLINPTHLGFLDPVATPESADTGIALHLPIGVRKARKRVVIDGKEREVGELETRVYAAKSDKWVWKTPADMEHAIVAYPDQVTWPNGKKGKPVPIGPEVVVYDDERATSQRPWSEVDYVLASSKSLFSLSTNLIPFLQNNNGSRAMMAAKQQEQAISLKSREAPLVQSKTEGALTFEGVLGAINSHRSPVAGTVSKIDSEWIHIKTAGGKVSQVPIYKHFPLNSGRGSLNAEPVVKKGDAVQKGQLLADTNFTKGGNLALGTNIRVAYVPYHGLNFEDGIVVSESASKKLTSNHMHQESTPVMAGTVVSKERWASYANPEKATAKVMGNLGDDGLVKEGTVVTSGDVLVALLRPARQLREEQELKHIHRSLVKDLRDDSLLWDHDHPGTVVKVIRTSKKITVHVTTEESLVVGDKLAGRHGNKGIVSRIIADNKMPKDGDGNAVHILLNPAGVPSRLNVGQVLETAASKIAEKTGKPYVVENFKEGVDYSEKVKKDLKRHGFAENGTEELFDPETGKSLGQVLTGKQYVLKLHHTVDKKITARSRGGAYSALTGAPVRGSGIPGGGLAFDQLTTYSMLSHGAKNNLREIFTFKSDKDQEEVWYALLTGQPLPAPKPSRSFNNFLALMRGMGVHTEKEGDKYVLTPMTDKQTKAISNGEVKFPNKALHAKGIRTIEETGGLFDKRVTGGLEGSMWSHISLQKRVPNPMFEGAIQSLTGVSKADFEKLVSEEMTEGESGFEIINKKLAAIDVDKELVETKNRLPKLSRTELDKAYKKVRYLQALKKLKITPLDAYTNTKLPVVPPTIRRVSIGLDGKQKFDDLNGLYLAVGQANEQIKKADRSTPPSEIHRQQSHLYDMVRSLRVTGMDPHDQGKKRHLKGLMETLQGTKPKESFFHKYVMSRRQDLSARSTIIPAPELSLDEVGLPIPLAMEMYKPFVTRRLHLRHGYTPLQAQELIQKKDPLAIQSLEAVVNDRPALMKRDPALHKFSVMAFRPRLTGGKAIGLHPLVTGGYNADFDGDAMALFVPVSEKAVQEAIDKMLPSKNLFSPTHGGLMPVPGQDSLLGLYQASKWGSAKTVPGTLTPAKAIKLMKNGKLKPTDVVTVGGKKTTPGRLLLASSLPPDMRLDEQLLHDKDFLLDKRRLKNFLTKVAKQYPKEFPKTVDEWKDHGNTMSYLNGSSFGIDDFHDGKNFRDSILKKYKTEEKKIRKLRLPKKARDKKIIELYGRATDELKTRGQARYTGSSNRVYEWADSGARGGWTQFSQLVFGPTLVQDAKKRTVPVPITKSFGEGLPLSQYWAALHGARKGTIDRAAGTKDPGAMAKNIVNATISYQVTIDDCGTRRGTTMSPSDHDAMDRYLAQGVALKSDRIEADTLLDPPTMARIRNAKVTRIVVRSPLYCTASAGICKKCFGLNENGKMHHIGTNVGVISGQAMSEPMTQMAMKTFHTGGVAAGSAAKGYSAFKRVKQLLEVPKTLPGSAVMSKYEGSIEKVEKNRAVGGYDVFIAGKKHSVPANLALLPTTKAGTPVKKGALLSEGPINPHELLKHTGSINKVRAYLTNELADVYPSNMRRRNIETVVRSMTNLARVHQAPGPDRYVRGQVAPLSELESENKLAREEGRPGITFRPVLKSIKEVPLAAEEDWLGRLNFNRLKNTYQEGAAQGWTADIHGKHPVAGLVHGAEFGLRTPY